MKGIKIMSAALALCIIAAPVKVNAQVMTMPDGAQFDPDYYAAAYPDVTAELGTDPSALYGHYTAYGAAEGRHPTDPGQQTPNQAQAQAQAQTQAVPTILGSITIPLYSSAGSNHNARRACDILNGHVINPGTEFSYNGTIGRRTPQNNFVPASILVGGRYITGYGGGVCKISTAVYNLCLQSGMTVTERHPHSHPAPYVPRGMDATVSYGSKDLKFINPLPFPVTIQANYDNNGFHLNLVQ